MRSIQNTFDYSAEEKGLVLSFNYDSSLVLEGDSLRLIQILNNLLSNAVKFTKKGSVKSTIETIKETDDSIELRFSIKDSGIGMSKEVQQKLFKDFSQADSSTTREYGGTGLGLVISKKLVELMDGEIWVESEEGKGSTFFFTIQFRKASLNDNDTDIENVQQDIETLKNKRVLIAEDNKTNQLVVMAMLEDYNMKLDFAENGQEAVDKFKVNEYDLILMDIQMPVMGGSQATELIREISTDIPIIALTAAVMKEDIKKTKEAGMNAHIAKPIDIKELVNKMLELL
jgi:CheY-like chemotaxis protein